MHRQLCQGGQRNFGEPCWKLQCLKRPVGEIEPRCAAHFTLAINMVHVPLRSSMNAQPRFRQQILALAELERSSGTREHACRTRRPSLLRAELALSDTRG